MEFFDAVIIGGGPSGLFCAIRCSTAGRRILLLEKKETCGNKLLIAGSGQCNITHDGDISGFLLRYGKNGKFLKPALFHFSNRDTVEYFGSCGVPCIADEHGKVFPRSRKSEDILACLTSESRRAGVDIRCSEMVIRIAKENRSFAVTTTKSRYYAGNLVITTGGMSYQGTGSTGDGYDFARTLGHTIRQPVPALTPVTIAGYEFSDLAGISFPAVVFSIWRDGKKISRCRGDVLFTHTGLSGPGILDNSRLMMAGDEIRLSCTGATDRGIFARDLSGRMQVSGGCRLASVLASYQLPIRFIRKLLDLTGISEDISCSQVSVTERTRILSALTELPFTIRSLGDFSVAMVTKGGVDLSEVQSKTMESRLSHGLYFAGEVLDIDGDTGGYNIQAALSTGSLAGYAMKNRWQEE